MSKPPAPQGDSNAEPVREPTAEQKAETEREAMRRDSEMWTKVGGYMLAGPLLYGGIGWAADHWLGTSFILPVGIIGGLALSLYLIWFRYGSH